MRIDRVAHHATERATHDAASYQPCPHAAKSAAPRFETLRTHATLALSACIPALAPFAHAQWNCPGPKWQSVSSYAGTSDFVLAARYWDSDGPGGAPARLVVGGPFVHAGSADVHHLAVFDVATQTWSAVGGGVTGPNATVHSLNVLPTGELLVGGTFGHAGGIKVNHLATWNGSQWTPLGGGVGEGLSSVRETMVIPGGHVIAAGSFSFTTSSGKSIKGVGLWDGAAWHPMGSATSDPGIDSLALLSTGDVAAGGTFTSIGGIPASGVARWDGVKWHPLAEGVQIKPEFNDRVNSLAVLPNGDMVAGGQFSTAGTLGAKNFARWNGVSWSPIGMGTDAPIYALKYLESGHVMLGGDFTTGNGLPASKLATWKITGGWAAVAPEALEGGVFCLDIAPDGTLAAGGDLRTIGTQHVKNLATRTGSTWNQLGASSVDRAINALEFGSDGNVLIGGQFDIAGKETSTGIASWNPATGDWKGFDGGVSGGTFPNVQAIKAMNAGEFVVGGSFTEAGGADASNIARWSPVGGGTWSALGLGTDQRVHALEVDQAGNLVAGGAFTSAGGVNANYVARWNNAAWSALDGGTNGPVFALATLPNGDLIAGGWYSMAGGVPAESIARWDGQAWTPVGNGLSKAFGTASIHALVALKNGGLVAGGVFSSAGGTIVNNVARWDAQSNTWMPMGSGFTDAGGFPVVYDMLGLQGGEIVASGFFDTAGGIQANMIARWNGDAWSPVGTLGVTGIYVLPINSALLELPTGDVLLGGEFATVDWVLSPYFARFGCPATSCTPDCDASGQLNIDDFICFQTNFVLGEMSADCDASGQLNIDDFICFQTLFVLGC